MKKAFTMIELVFVIVIIGILAAVIIPNTNSDRARDAAIQLASHIRYTQHLAMLDDKFDANDTVWYKKRWQITFNKGTDTNDKWSYTIFSDSAGSSTGSPDKSEVAVNPLNPSKKLTGGFNGTSFIHTGDDEATAEMNLGQKYGITDVVFSHACQFYGSTKIAFDHLGRPLKGAFENYSSAYPTASRIIQQQCVITLVNSESNASIAIEPETGYAHIL